MRFSLVLVLVLVAVVAVQAAHVLKEEIQLAPTGWTRHARALPTQELELTLMLKQRNLEQLEDTLFAVSDPASPRYGQHLTLEQVNEMVAPSEQTVSQVLQWLNTNGVHTGRNLQRTPNADMIRVRCTVQQAESMLHTEYYEFTHNTRPGVQIVRTLRYNVPTYLADAVDFIGPTVRFPSFSTVMLGKDAVRAPQPMPPKLTRAPNVDCSSTTPDCMKSVYSVGSYKASTNTSIAVTGYLEQYIAPSDLAAFFSKYDVSNTRSASIVGPNQANNPGTEASLDIQYGMGMAPGVPGTFWYTPGRQPGSSDNEPFLVFLQDLSSQASVPWVISTSYGDDEPTVLRDYAVRVNTEFQKAGVRGISILFSSGDGGVSGGQPQQCSQYIATYPAGSPYVTAVGGTTSFNPEVGVSFSSGGFTNYWEQPKYQSTAVEDYITTYGASTLPPQNLWNRTGRGFPDVAAAGTNYPVFIGGMAWPVSGTSCSCPTFSAIVSLLNDVRFKAGKSSLGFLNPLLYANPKMFTDITKGNNPGCGTNGFTAVTGWDPVTGLGTPNFEAMAAVVKNLP